MHRFFVALLVTTMTVGSLAFGGTVHAAYEDGDLLKSPSSNAVYFYAGGAIHGFVSGDAFNSYGFQANQIMTVSDQSLQAIPFAGYLLKSTQLVKTANDPKVYYVGANNTVHHVVDEQAARQLFGSDWTSHVRVVAERFFRTMTYGDPLTPSSSKDVTLEPGQAIFNELAITTNPTSVVQIATGNSNFETLVAALQQAGLVETLLGEGPFTVFAPTDEAFARVPANTLESLLQPENIDQLREILLYHVVPGNVPASAVVGVEKAPTVQGNDIFVKVQDGSVFLNGDTEVVATDLVADNGIVHVINSVLVPIEEIVEPSFGNEESESETAQSIVEIAVGNESFSALVAALQAAGLVEALSQEGPFTVFAPTNEAFNKLGEETIASLLEPENIDQLVEVLTYHVVSGDVRAADVVSLNSATTLQGNDITVDVVDGSVVLNDSSTVVATDVVGSNGVIHVIDTVLLP